MNSTIRSLLFWVALIVVALFVWNFSSKLQPTEHQIQFSEFLARVDSRDVASVTIVGNEVTGFYKDNVKFRTHAPIQFEGLANKLIDSGVSVAAKEPTASPWASLLYSWAPILLLIGF